MTVVYDAGVLIGADRSDRVVWADHRARLELGLVPITTAPVIAQVSRSSRQVQLRRFLRGCEIVAFEGKDAYEVGSLLAAAGTSDVVDAHVVSVAKTYRASVITSDRRDLSTLAACTWPAVAIVSV